MKKTWKKLLKQIYEAPAAERKREFFRSQKPQPLHFGHILWVQCAYMPKWEWVLSLVILAGIFIIRRYMQDIVLGYVLAVMPCLAAANVMECFCSLTYGMGELEMSARFSVKNVILARMGIMGIENLLLTVVLAVFTKEILLRGIMCLFTPYLFTVYLCFKLIRATHGREGIYACAAVAAFNGGLAFYSSFHWRWIFGLSYHFVWMAVMVMLFLLILCEGKRVLESELAYIV